MRPAGWRTRARLIEWSEATGTMPDIRAFWQATNPLSQWHPAPFTVNGVTYPTAEHWMMAAKAHLFGDMAALELVMAADTPKAAKAAGRTVAGFDETLWAARRRDYVTAGNVHKFTAHPHLAEALTCTGTSVLVEASPHDLIWGAGLAANDPAIRNPKQWPGLNLLGFALMDVRDILNQRTAEQPDTAA